MLTEIFFLRSEFETLPLLRSTFFHYGLGLARSEGLLQATVNTDNRGEANIYLNSQVQMAISTSILMCGQHLKYHLPEQ